MSLSHLPPSVSALLYSLAHCLDRRLQGRFPQLFLGILFARGRRTVTTWFRAAGIADDFRQAYRVVHAAGRDVDVLAIRLLRVVQNLQPSDTLTAAIDDTPTSRWGPCVEGAGIHHNPNPGPAGEKFVYGHVWVTMAVLLRHPDQGTRALPLRADLYVRRKDVTPQLAVQGVAFRTKLERAAEQLRWLDTWAGPSIRALDAVVDGAYAKRVVLRLAREVDRLTLFSRLPRNAALRSLPPTQRRPGQRGPLPTYGKERISLAKRAGQQRGWQEVSCVQYRQRVTKRVKTFLATWRPAGGVIRVVLVDEPTGWRAYFCTDPQRTAVEILEKAADRGAIEETFKDVKEVWGAGQQQVRNVWANVGAFNSNGWMYTTVEAWAWGKSHEELVNRRASPWDQQERRASHADKRKALQREVLRSETDAVLREDLDREGFRRRLGRLLEWLP
jgi:DDE superfamily endonuclease